MTNDPESPAGDLCEPGPEVDDLAIPRAVARQEIASLCGLFLRRLQDLTKDDAVYVDDMEFIFGEALRDFTTETEPGQ